MDEGTRVEMSGALERGDFVNALMWFAFKRRLWVRVLFVALVVGGALLVYNTSAAGARRDHGGAGLVGVAVAVPLLIAVIVATQFFSVRMAAKRQFDSSPGVGLPTKYVVDDDGVASENASASGRQRWDTFYEAHETKESFILLRSRVAMQILPKRLFRDEAQLAAFRAFARRHLGEKARLGSGPDA
jgi:hypothetical protein